LVAINFHQSGWRKTVADDINFDQESARFRDLISRAHRKNLVSFRTDLPTITLRSSEIPSPDDFGAVAKMMQLAAARGLQPTIVGGGYGCFQLALGDVANRPSAVEQVANDIEFQELAASLDADLITAATTQRRVVIERFIDIVFLVATNRQQNAQHDNNAFNAFGDGPDQDKMNYGLVKLQIASAAFSNKKNGASRWFSLAGLTLIDHPELKVKNAELTVLSAADFDKLLRSNGKKKSLMHVHGFATNFRDSLVASATLFQNLGLGGTQIAPVLYSWPSLGRKTRYDSDSRIAVNSSPKLRALLQQVVDAGSEASVIAHSHGNSLLIGAVTHISAAPLANETLDKGFFCAPDVDGKTFIREANHLADVFKEMSAYVSTNDLALKISGKKFGATRAGAKPVAVKGIDVIDASGASSGLVGHSYYAKAKTVLKDLRQALLGTPAATRFARPAKQGVYVLDV
jgi:esterase/lipase superfamily enzyme